MIRSTNPSLPISRQLRQPFLLHGGEGLDDAFAQLQKDGAEAVVLQPSLPSRRIAELALRQRLPSFAPSAGFPAVGGLLSYSSDLNAPIATSSC